MRKTVESLEKIYDENKELKKDKDFINDKIFYINGIENKIKKNKEEKDNTKMEPNMV